MKPRKKHKTRKHALFVKRTSHRSGSVRKKGGAALTFEQQRALIQQGNPVGMPQSISFLPPQPPPPPPPVAPVAPPAPLQVQPAQPYQLGSTGFTVPQLNRWNPSSFSTSSNPLQPSIPSRKKSELTNNAEPPRLTRQKTDPINRDEPNAPAYSHNKTTKRKNRNEPSNTSPVVIRDLHNWNRGSVSTQEPSSVSLVTYDRQKVRMSMIIYNPDGSVLMNIQHVVSTDLSQTVESFFERLKENRINYEKLAPSLRSVLRVGAMMPKIIADSAGSWQIGEYIRMNSCVLEYDPLRDIRTRNRKRIASIVVNYDTDTETFWFSDSIVFNHIPSTEYYSGNVFSFINAELMNIMMSLAHSDSFKPEYARLQESLKRLMTLYVNGLVDTRAVLKCKTDIETEFAKLGRFEFYYQQGGKAVLLFHTVTIPVHTFPIDIDYLKRRELTYTKIVNIISRPEKVKMEIDWLHRRFHHFEEYTTMDFRFVTLSALFTNMFGMDEDFFQLMKMRVLESLSKDNHDAARESKVNELCKPETTPILNLAVFKVFMNTESRHPQVVWVHVPDARNLATPGIQGCTSIANGSFPGHVQSFYGTVVRPDEFDGIVTCKPSANVNTKNQILVASCDSQRSTIRTPSNRPFLHTPPIEHFTIRGNKKLSEVEGNKSRVEYTLTYLGKPELLFTKDNQPFKTLGIVYLNNNGEFITVDGNVTSTSGENTLYDNLLLLINREIKYRHLYVIPDLVIDMLNIVFGVDRRSMNVKKVEKMVTDFISARKPKHSRKERSIHGLINFLDYELGDSVSSGMYQRQLDNLKSLAEPVCNMLTRESSYAFGRPANTPIGINFDKRAEGAAENISGTLDPNVFLDEPLLNIPEGNYEKIKNE